MFNFNKILFLNSLIFGSIFSISAISWMNMWIGLEINLMSFIPIMYQYKNIYSIESIMKYFITQVLASMILLFSIILSMSVNEFINPLMNSGINLLMNSSLLMKMGMAPFHFWFPEIMDGLNWNSCMLMLTWQKITPIVLISYNIQSINFISIIIIISAIIGSVMSLNQLSMRKILTYSSISHMSWMMSSIMMNKFIWMNYFIIYSFMIINLISILKLFNIFYLNQLLNLSNLNIKFKILFMFNFFSLGGMPPFIGFFPKWMVINQLIFNKFYLMPFILIIFSLITLYMYIRLTFNSLTLMYSTNLNFKMNKMNFISIIINLNILISLIFFIYWFWMY
uniref:NADH-ubiquinone oxidoreductase chain 2 n=1 Tax=Discolomatidae sp. 4 ACP-2013 TaxID=1434487 RepID=A0A3G3FWF6_9CUCU|nr:NADH dehydrogenase subunit 2 [Discolomatidae sp. 4 ACP-2013]